MVTSTKGMNDKDYRGELGSRLARAKEIAREAIKMYEKEGTEEAKAIAERAVKTARGLNAALTGPSPDLAGGPQSPSQGILSSVMAPYQQYAQSRLEGASEPPRATSAADVNPNAMVQSDMLGNSPATGRNWTDVDLSLPEQPVNSPYAGADLGGTVEGIAQGFANMGGMEWLDEAYTATNELLFGVDPEVSKQQYAEHRARVEEESPMATGFGQALGTVATMKALPSSQSGSQIANAAVDSGLYIGALEAGKAADGTKLEAFGKGFTGGALLGGAIMSTVKVLTPVADAAKNFKLKVAIKRAEKEGTITSLKNLEKEAYNAIPKGKVLFDDVAQVKGAVDDALKETMHVSMKNAPTNVERAIAMVDDVTSGGKLDMMTYKQLRTNLHNLVDDTPAGNVVSTMINKLDDVAKVRMEQIGDKSLLAAREASHNLRKATMLEDAFKQAARESKTVGSQHAAFTTYRNAAERILKSNEAKFLSDSEKLALERFITAEGDKLSRVMGNMANLAPSQSNFWAVLHIAGFATQSPLAFLASGMLEANKQLFNARTVKQAESLIKQFGGVEKMQKVLSDAKQAPEFMRALSNLGYNEETIWDMLFPAKVERSKPK